MPTQRKTTCNRDCPDACGIIATIENERVVRLQGDPDHPVTGGFLCYRTNQFLRTQYSKARITQPLLRKNGAHARVSWDEALDFAADQLLRIRAESGPEAIFHYRSGGTLGAVVAQASDLFFERFGPVTVKRGDICSGAGEAAQELDFGISDSSDLFDLENARHILLWGKNVCTSSPHTLPVLKRAAAKLVLIDPLHHQSAALSERHIQLRPGEDFALAMAVAQLLFTRGWIDPDAEHYCDHLDAFRALAHSQSIEAWCARADVDVEQAVDLARRLHEGPTTILIGWGMARRRAGAAIVRAIDALAAVSGNLGVPGGGASYYFRRRSTFRKLADGLSARTICEPLFGPEVLAADPPIRALWITAGNPVAMLPDSRSVARALETRELVVVVDSWMSDTAERAHLVLPTNTLLEADDLLGAYGHHHLAQAQPVVAPPEGVKSDLEIFQELAARVGLDGALAGTARQWKERIWGDELTTRGLSLASSDAGPIRNPMAPRVLFEGRRFHTESGRVNLICAAPSPVDHDARFPLQLLSVSTPRSQSSQWAKAPPRPTTVTVHPDAARGISDGELCTLQSTLGEITVRIEHDARQRRDVALVPKGGHLRDGSCANVLLRAQLTDLGEGGALYDEYVRLLPLDSGAPRT
jgi:anaerobic selenocysteine-containing dehydrogenase